MLVCDHADNNMRDTWLLKSDALGIGECTSLLGNLSGAIMTT